MGFKGIGRGRRGRDGDGRSGGTQAGGGGSRVGSERTGLGAGGGSDRTGAEALRGTLDLLVLKILQAEPMHGWGITQRIRERSKGLLDVNQGSLYPALQRLEGKGLVVSEWERTENNRRARFYRLTASGRSEIAPEEASWRRHVEGVSLVLAGTEAM